jgi:hypothetical protein
VPILIVLVLVLYLPFVFAEASLIRRANTGRIAVAFVPLLNVLAMADLAGVTRQNRFDAMQHGSVRAEIDRERARNGKPFM